MTQLQQLSFCTPIHYEARPPCFSANWLRECADAYFDWGNQTATVLAGFPNRVQIRTDAKHKDRAYWIVCALKVASYITLIIPALMYLAKWLLRSSPFYVLNIQWRRMSNGEIQIGRIIDDDKVHPGVYIHPCGHEKILLGFADGSAEESNELMRTLIVEYPTEIDSEASQNIQQLFQKIDADPFVYHALCMAYLDHETPPIHECIPSTDRTIHRKVEITFKTKIFKTLISYLAKKPDATLTEKWILKALLNETFTEAEFMELDTSTQRAICCLAKVFQNEKFWPLAESFLIPRTHAFHLILPDVLSEKILAYVEQPAITGRISRIWAHLTRNALKHMVREHAREKIIAITILPRSVSRKDFPAWHKKLINLLSKINCCEAKHLLIKWYKEIKLRLGHSPQDSITGLLYLHEKLFVARCGPSCSPPLTTPFQIRQAVRHLFSVHYKSKV